jgi:hypothetical protein
MMLGGLVEAFPASSFLRKFLLEHALPEIKILSGVVARPHTCLPAKIIPRQFSGFPPPLNAD